MTRENNQAAGKTWIWTYDNAGNITSRKEYAYTTATSPGTATSTVDYFYDDSGKWGDLLTQYGNNTVTSDAIGNTLSDGTRTYTWKHGRTLAETTMDGKTWTYTYNADGMRTKRVSGNTAYTYYYNGDMLRYLDYDFDITDSNQAAKLYFVLDASGNPIEVSYRPEGSTTTKFYYYVQNLQGDVIALVDSANGNTVVTYTYDAWGNVLDVDGSLKTTLGVLNPFRYRGYVYDSETELYYLQSRYYNPEMGRFINADGYASTGQGLLGNNMFAYCNNNPVNAADPSGQWSITAIRCIISVATSVICDIASQASMSEIVVNAVVAAVSTVFEPLGTIVTCVNAIDTAIDVAQATGDWGFGLFMGGLVIGSSLCTGKNIGKIPGVENLDEAAELFLDATVGLSANLISAKSTYDYTDGYSPEVTSSKPSNYTRSKSDIYTNRNTATYAVMLY